MVDSFKALNYTNIVVTKNITKKCFHNKVKFKDNL